MARASKPVALCERSTLTMEEREARLEAEKKFKGNNDLVYQVPEELTTPTEQELYLFLVEQLKSANILNNLDIEILKSTVFCIMRMNEANDHIKKHGATLEDANGKIYKNPNCNIYKDYHNMFITNSIRLGLTPSDRAKLAIIDTKKKEEDADPLLKILNMDN